MLGLDIGGDAVAAGPVPTAAQLRRRARRLKLLYGHLYRHVVDLRLREMMHAQARNDGRAAFRILEQTCRRDITDLEMFALNEEWDRCTFLSAVGLSADTITMFSRYLGGLNARRPATHRKNNDGLTIKLLSCFTPSAGGMALTLKAHEELRAPAASRLFHDAATGQRDFNAAVQALDELWRSHFHAGAIKPTPRRIVTASSSVRVDGTIDPHDSANVSSTMHKDRKPKFDLKSLRSQPMCWNCRGFGHMQDDCPSDKGIRFISHCITVLKDNLAELESDKSARKPDQDLSEDEKASDEAQMISEVYYEDDGDDWLGDECFMATYEQPAIYDKPDTLNSAEMNDAVPPSTKRMRVNLRRAPSLVAIISVAAITATSITR